MIFFMARLLKDIAEKEMGGVEWNQGSCTCLHYARMTVGLKETWKTEEEGRNKGLSHLFSCPLSR